MPSFLLYARFRSLYLLCGLLILAAFSLKAQVSSNYVRTQTVLVAGKTTDASLVGLPIRQLAQTTTYLDGLGRPIQTVTKQNSPAGLDLVVPQAYDALGRETRKYLPYTAGSDGLFKSNAIVAQSTFYAEGNASAAADGRRITNAAPFADSRFEDSPLNRVLEQGAPGSAWQITDLVTKANNKTIKLTQRANRQANPALSAEADDNVRLFTYTFNEVDPALFGSVSTNSFYDKNQLWVSETADELNYLTLEYKDKEGRVVLKKVQLKSATPPTAYPFGDANYALTYYVYDDLGQLRLVMQPEGSARLPASGSFTLNQNTSSTNYSIYNNLCFSYHYDAQGRMIEKHVPGAGYVYMVYNARDELILVQDANQALRKEWSFTKYDALGRVVLTGLYTHPHTVNVSQKVMQGIADGLLDAAGAPASPVVNYSQFETHSSTSFTDQYYTKTAFPTSNVQILSANYYDDYDINNDGTIDFNFDLTVSGNLLRPYTFTYDADQGPVAAVKGKRTASRVRELGSTASDPYLPTYTFYDKQGRTIQTHERNHRGGWQRSLQKLDFAGKVTNSELRHNVTITGASTVNTYKTFSYDEAGRLLSIIQQYGTATNTDPLEKVVEYAYNELGQVKWKKIGNQKVPINGNPFLQKIDYRYNIRGWLTHINDAALSTATNNTPDNDLFGMELLYNEGKNLSEVEIKDLPYAQFNGNIALQKWKTRVDESATARQYTYFYDPANRLTTANYVRAGNSLDEQYTMNGVDYDKNGNIKSMKQRGLVDYEKTEVTTPTGKTWQSLAKFGLIDDLTYSYEANEGYGNKLTKVVDAVVMPADKRYAGDFQENKADNNATDYTYDGNGNLKTDVNKGIVNIVYNHLNLPGEIWFKALGASKIKFVYSAAGTKLKKEVWVDDVLTGWTDYAGGFVYERDKLQFFPTEEGRAINPYFASNPAGTAYTYEYHYKDHLGNLRLSFRDPKPTAYFRATMEKDNGENVWEDVQFANLTTTRVQGGKTHLGSYASELKSQSTPGNEKTLGPFKTLKVKSGDKIVMQVYANYTQPTGGFTNGVSISTYVTNADNITGGTESGKNIPLLQLGVTMHPAPPPATGLPKAYLRYEYFDESYTHIRSETRLVTSVAQGTNWQLLTLELGTGNAGVQVLDRDGYVQIYVANESNQPVRFDDLEIAYTEAMVVQENHYAPFGLNLAGIGKQGQPDHKFKFNGIEQVSDLDLNVYHARYRVLDQQLGRWWQIDPEVEGFESLTPYNNNENNPIKYTDPDGDFPWVTAAIGGVVGGVVGAGVALYDGKNAQDVLIAAAGGAVSGAIVGSGVGLIAELGVASVAGAVSINAASGFVAGAAQETTTQGLEKLAGSRENFQTGKIVQNAAVGAVANVAAGELTRRVISPLIKNVIAKTTVSTTARTTGQQAQQQVRQSVLKSNPALANNNKELNKTMGNVLRQRKADAASTGQAAGKATDAGTQVAVESANQKASNTVNDKLNEQNKRSPR